jgi:hypothetical protein
MASIRSGVFKIEMKVSTKKFKTIAIMPSQITNLNGAACKVIMKAINATSIEEIAKFDK